MIRTGKVARGNSMEGELRSSLRRTMLAMALGVCVVGGVHAQSNTAGAVTGQATAGDSVTISNSTTGFSRTVTVGADGAYRFSQLPVGEYQISRNGASPRNVRVQVGTASTVDFTAAQELDSLTVYGASSINPIDVSSVESTTILTASRSDDDVAPKPSIHFAFSSAWCNASTATASLSSAGVGWASISSNRPSENSA